MLVIVGALIVLGSVAGGYLMEGGKPLVLNQPAEFIIIGGAALGSLLIGTPPSVIKKLLAQMKTLFGAGTHKNDYNDLLAMLYQLFKVAQQSGVMALEPHFEAPANSNIMTKYPKFLSRHHAVDFLADSIKVIIIGGIGAHDFEALMDEDLDVRHHEEGRPAATLGKVDGPASEIGHKVGAALVGTFLGILMSYGFTQPLATNLEQRVLQEAYYEQCIKAGVLAMYKGFSPMVSVEFARRVLPDELRPTFDETEKLCKGVRSETAAAA
jgi:chemotaxis protein MotA